MEGPLGREYRRRSLYQGYECYEGYLADDLLNDDITERRS